MNQTKLTAKQKFWQQHIEAWRRSGVTRKAYCDSKDLNLSHFSYFISYLKKKRSSPGGFVRVGGAKPPPITIRLSSGVVIEYPAGGSALVEVVRSLLEVD